MTDAPLDAAALAAIRERCEQATPGPWKWEGEHDEDEDGTEIVYCEELVGAYGVIFEVTEWPAPLCVEADSEFIAAARTDLPRLLDAYTHQQERLQELEVLVRNVVANARDRRRPRWALVKERLAVGSTRAQALCHAYGFDPEETL